jgi:hypothetical protein
MKLITFNLSIFYKIDLSQQYLNFNTSEDISISSLFIA